jgi:hypothetical protein
MKGNSYGRDWKWRPPMIMSAVTVMTVMLPCAAFAQRSTPQSPPAPAVNPGRPTITDTASLTAPGYLELEVGLNYAKGGAGLDYQVTQAFLLKLTDRQGRMEFRVSTNGYVLQRTTGGSAAVSTPSPITGSPAIASNSALFAQGFGDTTFGVQHLIVAQTPRTYDLSARLEYKLPTGGANVGTGKSDYNLLFLASKDYSDRFHADYNFDDSFLGHADGPGHVQQAFASAAFTYKLPHGFTIQTELYGYSGNRLNGTNLASGYGFTYTARPDSVYDGYINFGLTRAAPKYFVTVGHTFFLGKLF